MKHKEFKSQEVNEPSNIDQVLKKKKKKAIGKVWFPI